MLQKGERKLGGRIEIKIAHTIELDSILKSQVRGTRSKKRRVTDNEIDHIQFIRDQFRIHLVLGTKIIWRTANYKRKKENKIDKRN